MNRNIQLLRRSGWDVLERCGKGSYGEVFRLRHGTTGQVVVIKRVNLSMTSGAREYWDEEVTVSTYLSRFDIRANGVLHPIAPRVLQTYTCDEVEGGRQGTYGYMVMEELHMSMWDLFRHLQRISMALAIEATKMLFREQVLPILNVLASNYVMHLDAGPANFMVRLYGSGLEGVRWIEDLPRIDVYLIDMGFALRFDQVTGALVSRVPPRPFRYYREFVNLYDMVFAQYKFEEMIRSYLQGTAPDQALSPTLAINAVGRAVYRNLCMVYARHDHWQDSGLARR